MTADQYYDSIRADRDAWRAAMPKRCMACRRSPDDRSGAKPAPLWLEIHEMESRAHAPNNWWHRCSALMLCHWCHPRVAGWPHARQLALKLIRDRKHFDLAAWLAIRPHPAGYVTMDEIDEWVRKMDWRVAS